MPAVGHEATEGFQRKAVAVMVEIQKDRGIGSQGDQRITHREDIPFAPADVLKQQPRPVAAKPCVPQGKAYRLLRRERQSDTPEDQTAKDQAEAKAFPSESAKRRRLARIIRATRAMATPRITRLAGR